MCGIIGQINFKKTKPKLDCFYAANEKQAFRGPDDEGIILDGVLLGHKRLSILDLSQHAHQPMSDAKLGLIIVFNGEIYNFKDVKKKLVKKGYSFHSTGDTEVVLKAYHAWKEKCLEKFFGMFSIAVWDKQKQELFLAKDHLGIKPLYYYQDKNRFRFASHLPSLLEFNDFNPLLDRTALNYYFSFHAIVPAPHTIIKQIKKLEPGTWAKINKHGKIKKQKYWEMNFETQKINNYEKCKKLVLSSLDESVQRHMESDVPVGVLLSGGLDSSLIVALLSKHSQKNLKTFSIGFEDEKEKGNEFEYSDLIASEFSTKHKKIFIKNENAIKNLEQCVSHMSEPMVSHDAIGFYLLSNEVSKHVKVVQSGQGADEVFAGYHW
ncbi:MAG: asparagine synthase (glutamine-hydrolyzing), partial [Candidatus Micrarchaeia archaeon]